MTASKPPSGRAFCQYCQTPGKAASQCRKGLAVGNGAGVAPQVGKRRAGGFFRAALPLGPPPSERGKGRRFPLVFLSIGRDQGTARQQREGIAGIGAKGRKQWLLDPALLALLQTRGQPAQTAQEVHQAAQVGGAGLHAAEQIGGLAHLRHVGVRHFFDLLHAHRGVLGRGDGGAGEQAGEAAQLAGGVVHPQADERVAAEQVVIEERQRRADGEAVQPQRHLGQLHGEAVLVHPVDAALEHHAADDGLVGQLRRVDHPVGRCGALQDVAADLRHALHEGRFVGRVQPVRHGGRGLDQVGDGVGEEVHRGDEEVAAAHGRVQHLEVQNGLGGVELAEFGEPLGLGAAVASQGRATLLECRQPFFRQGLEGAIDDQVDEFLGRVKTAAVFADVRIGADGNLRGAVAAAHRFVLQQALVDGAELLHGHVAVVDEARPGVGVVRRGVAQVVDDGRHHGIGKVHGIQHRRGAGREQAAVVGRQADGGVAPVDEVEQVGEVGVVVAGGFGKGVALPHSGRHAVAYVLAQAVVVVARFVDGQQAPILGVEDEQQAVQENQGGLTDVGQAAAAGLSKGRREPREDALENDT